MGVDGVEIETRDGNTIVITPERARRLVTWLLESDAFGALSMASQLQAVNRWPMVRARINGLTASENAALRAALDATP